MSIPKWLQPTPPPPEPVSNDRELQLMTFDSIFMSVMDKLAAGTPISTQFANDPRNLDIGRFMRWVLKSPARKAIYDECNESLSEVLWHEIIPIADGTDNPMEEVQRANIRIETRKFFMKVANKRKFADTKSIDVTTKNITEDSIKAIPTEELMQMMIDGEFDIIESTLEDVKDERTSD